MWRKESKNKNALYVNICGASGLGKDLNEVYHNIRSEINQHKKMSALYMKSNATAQLKRTHARFYFENRQWDEAIEFYNESLCFAEPESIDLSVAYANRSACFFNLKMFDKCTIDIDLAIKNNCPKHLLPNLIERQRNCIKLIKTNGLQSNDKEPQLNFKESEQFPGMSNVLSIEKDQNNKQSIFATKNIDVGQIIAIDKGFVKTSFTIYGWKCNICLKSNTNLVPCKKCTTAMFCQNCEDNNLHKNECGMKTSLYSAYNNYLMQELRTFFIAMNLFSNADEMMNFVEKCIASDPLETTTSFDNNQSKYRAFFMMGMNIPTLTEFQLSQIIFCVYKILLEIPAVGVMFETRKHRRFLMHLVGHHVQINIIQSFIFTKEVQNERGETSHRKLYSQIGLLLNYFQHSCSPNIMPFDRDGDTIYIAVRPIETGQQLFISNYSFHWDPRSEWHKKTSNKIKCNCERCENRLPSKAEISEISLDLDYNFINLSYFKSEFDYINQKTHNILHEKCIALLKKYGRILWCTEFGIILSIYTMLMQAQFHGNIQSSQDDDLNDNS